MLREDPSAYDSNSKRVQYFESIWQKTKGSDFEKTLAMLRAYCKTVNWGTHQYSVCPIIEKYFGSKGYLKTVENKNVLLFSIEFLLLQLSEQIYFSQIKPEGNLSALFQVLRHHTNINPHDYDSLKGLYQAYKPYMNEIKACAATTASWKDIFEWLVPVGNRVRDESLISEFYKAKFIDYVYSWELMDIKRVDRLDIGCFFGMCPIADEELENLLFSDKIQNHGLLIQSAYCEKNKLGEFGVSMACDLEREPSIQQHLALLHALVKMSKYALSLGRDIDSAFLLDRVKRMHAQHLNIKLTACDKESYMNLFYRIFMGLIEIRKSLENWNEIEALLFLEQEPGAKPETMEDIDKMISVENKKIDFTYFLYKAIFGLATGENAVDIINYLLNEKKIKIDLKAKSHFMFQSTNEKTLIQVAIEGACRVNFYRKDASADLEDYLKIIRMLVKYDPDCVRFKNSDGWNIFNYMNKLYAICAHCKISERDAIWTKIDAFKQEIDRAYYGKLAFMFYSGKKDVCEQPGELPNDVLKIIAANTMCDITVRKGS